MNSQITNMIIGIAMMVAVGTFVYWQTQMSPSHQPNDTAMTSNRSADADASQQSSANAQGVEITAAQVAQHNSRTSCWSALNGKVYDLTSWIPQHPGGEQAILSICGIDGSRMFNAQHGGNPEQAAILVGFKIGDLAK